MIKDCNWDMLGYIKCVITIILFNVGTGEFKITCVVHVLLLLDRASLEKEIGLGIALSYRLKS